MKTPLDSWDSFIVGVLVGCAVCWSVYAVDELLLKKPEPFKKEALAARAVIESGQILIKAQQDLIATLEVQLVIVREERDTWKKLANPPVRTGFPVTNLTNVHFFWITNKP